MGVFSSQDTERPRRTRRTIWVTFAAMVAGPVACLVVLWGLLLTGVIGGAVSGPDTPENDRQVVVNFVTVVGLGLAIIVIGVTLMGFFARRLARDITDLEATARHLAEEEMPQLMERLRQGEQGVAPAVMPRQHTKTAEIARAQAAITSLQHTAVAAAAGEAGLRNGIGQVFVSLARRNQSLLQRQLRLIDTLEQKASDPATLADLFPLDHLTTRMRRHAEGLIILSGAAPGRSWSEPVPVIDVIRGAVAEVEDYKRVTVLTRAEDAVAGLAAADMIHLMAELIENATLSSPSGTRVEVRAERVANGFAIEIDDRGLGIEAGQLETINQQLAQPPDFDLANADQLGLFVVGKLAARHGVRVALRPSPYGGTTAVVLMPNSIVVPMNETEADTQPDFRPAIGGPPGLDLRHADALALTGRHSTQPSLSSGPTGETETADGSFSHALGSADPAPGQSGFAPSQLSFGPSSPAPDQSRFGPGSPAPGQSRFGPGSPAPGQSRFGSGSPAAGPSGFAPNQDGPGSASPAPGPSGFAPGQPRFGSGSPAPGQPGSGSGSPAPGPSVFAPGQPGSGSPAPGPSGFAPRQPGPGAASPAPSPSGFAPRQPGPGAASPAPGPSGFAPGQPGPGAAGDASDTPGLAPGPQTAGTYRGLPRRVRQASLNPRLRDNPSAAVQGKQADGTPPSTARSPEEARSLVASLQSGWLRGRKTDTPDGEPADAAQTAGRPDSEAPQGEETLWTSRVPPRQANS